MLLPITLILLLLCTLTGRAQQFQSFNSAVNRHYQRLADNYVYTAQVDSLGMSGADSMFYSYVQGFKGYVYPSDPYSGYDLSRYSWWGKSVRISGADTNEFVNYKDHNLTLRTQAVPGDEWVFCQLNVDSVFYARVDSIVYMTIGGVLQPVKEIVLELRDGSNQVLAHPFNGKKILLSEQNGLTQTYDFYHFPADTNAFYLSGEDRSWGVYPISNSEVYDFQAGDLYRHLGNGGGETTSFWNYEEQEILQRWETNDTIHYLVRRYYKSNYYDSSTGEDSYNVKKDTIHWKVYKRNPAKYHLLLIDNNTIIRQYANDCLMQWYEIKHSADMDYYTIQYGKNRGLLYHAISGGDYHSAHESVNELSYFNGQTNFLSCSLGLVPGLIKITPSCDSNRITLSYPTILGQHYCWRLPDGTEICNQDVTYTPTDSSDFTVQLKVTNGTKTGYYNKQVTWDFSGSSIPGVEPGKILASVGNQCNEAVITHNQGVGIDAYRWVLPDGSVQLVDTLNYTFLTLNPKGFTLISYSGFCRFKTSVSLRPVSMDNFPVAMNCPENPNQNVAYGALRDFEFFILSFTNSPLNLATKGCLQTRVYPGQKVPLKVTAGDTAGGLWQGTDYQLWIDYNNDGLFAANERVAKGATPDGITATDIKPAADTFQIPMNVVMYQKLRLRVQLGGVDGDPCSGNSYDFSVYAVDSAEFLPPIARDDVVIRDEDESVNLSILNNDEDSDGYLDFTKVDLDLKVSGIQYNLNTAEGNWKYNTQTKQVLFTPEPNFFGQAICTYQVQDNELMYSDTAKIIVQVNSVNDAPIAVNDELYLMEDQEGEISILQNDYDIDGKIHSIDLNPNSAGIQNTFIINGGMFKLLQSGVVHFTPLPNYFGHIAISYEITDNEGATSTADLDVYISSLNDLPVAQMDSAITEQGVSVSIEVTKNDYAPDTPSIGVKKASVDLSSTSGIQTYLTTPEGEWKITAPGVVTFKPTPDFIGETQIYYRVSDWNGSYSPPAIIKVLVVSDPAAGVNSISMQSTVVLYPNPATDQVHVAGAEVQQLKVYDLNGRVLYQGTSADFGVQGWAPGHYLVQVLHDHGVSTILSLTVN